MITSKGELHFVVVFKINKNKVVIGDPAAGICKLKTKDFLNHFTGKMVIMAPSPSFTPMRARS